MRTSELIVVGYLAYLSVLAWIMPLPASRRRLVTTVALVDIVLIWWVSRAESAAGQFVRDWLPAIQILVAYWLSGAFFLAPMPRIEAWLASWDRRLFDGLGVDYLATRGPRWLLEYLEFAYLTVYGLVPAGFGVVYFLAPDADVDRYWTVVAGADLLCYAMLPWIQTRPPRALRLHCAIEDRRLAIHRLNTFVLGLGSIQVNTFPSGHAAAAFATALAVGLLVPAAFLPFLVLAASITIASVIGRYHYAADSVAGVLIAIAMWVAAA
jgi:membrane-associated phospholipid phosphatase